MVGHQPHCVSTFQNTASAVFILRGDGIVVASIEPLTNEQCSFVIGHGGSGHPCAILHAQHARAAAAGRARCPHPTVSPCPLVGSGSSADAAYAARPALYPDAHAAPTHVERTGEVRGTRRTPPPPASRFRRAGQLRCLGEWVQKGRVREHGGARWLTLRVVS
jgi:hypothetical protein